MAEIESTTTTEEATPVVDWRALRELVSDDVVEHGRRRGVALTVFLPHEPLRVRGSATQLAQILVNLVGNAADAVDPLPEGKRAIELRVKETGGGKVSVAVVDSGPGVPPAIAARIMEPFFTTKAPGKGTGLGLSISHGLAQSMGGELSLDTKASRTTFVLTLRRA